ncbi:hypothetical protein PInf_023577 [Phytophthora infestans]|nr:hypothetical protein PInf_023577 [Phytophthora infestans]
MSGNDKKLMLTVLHHYSTLLEPREGCPPMTSLEVEHEILTGNMAPIKVRPSRHSPAEQELSYTNVEDMLKSEVVEEAAGSGDSPSYWCANRTGRTTPQGTRVILDATEVHQPDGKLFVVGREGTRQAIKQSEGAVSNTPGTEPGDWQSRRWMGTRRGRPVADREGNRYVVSVLEYATSYAVVAAPSHTVVDVV